MTSVKFSVLIPVYHGDKPEFFHQALESIYVEQNLKPDQLVIVIDGPIPKALEDVISSWLSKHHDLIKLVRLSENVGLGIALSKGLEECHHDLVARMDSDDVARENRFEKQIEEFRNDKNLKICGSNVHEFVVSTDEVSSSKIVPRDMEDIVSFAKYRNPINHPTVMFSRQAIQNVGGYIPMRGFEDYYLWVRCILAGYTFYNIQECLVSMRGGQPQLARRSGLIYVRDEIAFFYAITVAGFISFPNFLVIVSLRSVLRLLPRVGLRRVYRLLRKK